MVLKDDRTDLERLTAPIASGPLVTVFCITRTGDVMAGRSSDGGSCATMLPLEHSRLPLAWHDQRTVLGFA